MASLPSVIASIAANIPHVRGRALSVAALQVTRRGGSPESPEEQMYAVLRNYVDIFPLLRAELRQASQRSDRTNDVLPFMQFADLMDRIEAEKPSPQPRHVRGGD